MPALAMSFDVVVDSINRFGNEVRCNARVAGLLAHARAWYAYRDEDGHWRFGPSKFIGYMGLTGDEYVDLATQRRLNVRRTETQLQQWFERVDPTTELHGQLSTALSTFLAEYGKAPSRKMRISIPREVYHQHLEDGQNSASAPVLDLIVAVAESLQPSDLAALRTRLIAIGTGRSEQRPEGMP